MLQEFVSITDHRYHVSNLKDHDSNLLKDQLYNCMSKKSSVQPM